MEMMVNSLFTSVFRLFLALFGTLTGAFWRLTTNFEVLCGCEPVLDELIGEAIEIARIGSA